MIKHRLLIVRAFVMALLPVLLIMAVACGAAGKPAAPAAAPQKEAPAAAAPAKAPAAAATPAPKPADVVNPGKVIVMVGGFGNERILPRYAMGENNHYGRLLHGYFGTTSHQGGVLASAAESWTVSPDGKDWTIKLRKGIKFHNGETATVEDALFSLDRSVSLDNVPEQATTTNQVEGRRIAKHGITGPDEVTSTFKESNPYFLAFRSEGTAGNLKMNLLPRKLLGEPYDKTEPAYEKAPIGAGPMKMTARSPAQSMSFERFDDYYYQPKYGAPEDRRVQVKNLDLLLVPELSTRVAALRAGQADLVESAEAVRKQVEGADARFIYARESSYVYGQLPGCWRPELRCYDKRVREALDYAIDREVILKTLYTPESFSMEGWVWVTPSSLGYTPALKGTSFDPNRARELLKAAGYKVPGSPAGKDFGKMTIYTVNFGDVPFIPDMAQLIAEYWKKELGIETAVQVGDRTATTLRRNARELDDNMYFYTNEARWDGGNITSSNYNDPKNSTRSAEDPAMGQRVVEAFKALDTPQRQTALAPLYLEFQEARYQLHFGFANLPWAAGKRIAEWKPWPVAGYFTAAYTVRLK
jgi:peptide/nickel transport system substrate-binding protein